MQRKNGLGVRRHMLALAVGLLGVTGSAGAGPVSSQGTWETTLKARDIGGNALASLNDPNAVFFYDTVLDITWLRDWNAGAGSSFDNGSSLTDGRMTWSNAVAWANALTVGGFGNWRLPTVSPSDGTFDYGFSNNGSTDLGTAKTGVGWGTASEFGHMFYVTLGNKGICTPNDGAPGVCPPLQPGFGLSNTAQFTNMQNDYWSGTTYGLLPDSAWIFITGDGSQDADEKTFELYATAVRSGDVAAIPEPGSVALLLAGLGVLGAMVRRSSR